MKRSWKRMLAPLLVMLMLSQSVLAGAIAQDATPVAEPPITAEEPGVVVEQPEEAAQPEGAELVETESPETLPEEQDELPVTPEGVGVTAAADQDPVPAVQVRPRAVVGPGVTGVTVTPTVLENVCDPVRMDITWAVDDSAQSGDTFSFTLDPRLNVTNMVLNLSAPDGSVVGSLRLVDGVATVTLTDYVDSHSNVRGTAWFESAECWAEEFEGTVVDLTFSGSEEFTIPVTVPIAPTPVPTEPPPTPTPGTSPQKSGEFTREDQGRENQENAILWTVTAPSGPSGGVTITDNAGDNWIFECSTIAWLNGIEPVDFDCSENGVTAEFGPYADQWYPLPGFTIEATITGEMPEDPEDLLTFRNTAEAESSDWDGNPLDPGQGSAEVGQTAPPEPTPTPDPNETPTPQPTPTPGVDPEKSGSFTDDLDQGKTQLDNAILWTITAPPGPAGGITITDAAGPNWVFECDTLTFRNGIEPVDVDCTPELLVVEFGPYASAESPWWPLPEFTIEASVTTPISTSDKTFTNEVVTVVNGYEGEGEIWGEGSRTSSLQQSSSGGGGGVGDNLRVPVTPTILGNVCVDGEYVEPTVEVDDLDSGLIYDIGEVDPETGDFIVTATLAPGQEWGDLTDSGWIADGQTATFSGTVELVDCEPEDPDVVTPVAPLVVQAVCTDENVPTDPTVTLPEDTDSIAYTTEGEIVPGGTITVTATIIDDAIWGELAAGWTIDPENTNVATYTIELDDPDCTPESIETMPVAPTVTGNVCVEGVSVPPALELAETEGITYEVTQAIDENGDYVVTATLVDGYTWGDLASSGWVVTPENEVQATFAGSVELNPCDEVIPVLPVVNQAVCTGGELIPPTVTAAETTGVTYELEGGIAPGATVLVTATLDEGYAWPSELPAGWIAISTTTATATLILDDIACDEVIPAAPIVTSAVCTDGTLTEPQVTLQETDGIDYTLDGEIVSGGTVIVTATLEDGKAWGELPEGWTRVDETTATFIVELDDVECAPAVPVAPTVTGNVCVEGVSVPPMLELAETGGITYEVVQGIDENGDYVVTATLADGYAWGELPQGWTKTSDTSATYNGTVELAPCVEVVPVDPGVTPAVCEDETVQDPTLTLPETPGVTYTVDGEVVPGGKVIITATLQDGYAWGTMPEGWTQVSTTTATTTVTFDTITCETPVDPSEPTDPATPEAGRVSELPATGSGLGSGVTNGILMALAAGALTALALGIRLRKEADHR